MILFYYYMDINSIDYNLLQTKKNEFPHEYNIYHDLKKKIAGSSKISLNSPALHHLKFEPKHLNSKQIADYYICLPT